MADRNFIVNMVIGARDQATRVVRGLSAALGKLNNRVTQVGAALGTYFGVQALANFFGGAIGSARDFEAQLARVQAATGATAEEMEKLKAAASEAGRTTRFTATEAAQGLEILGRAGVSATDSIKLLPQVLNTAVAAGVDLATAAGIITDSLGAFNKSADEAGRFADVLAQGARLANTSMQDLGSAVTDVGVETQQAGFSFEQTVALLDALANAGIRGGEAATSLSSIIRGLQDPASEARDELRNLGIDTSDLTTVLDGLNKAGPDAQASILAFGEEAGPGLRVLLQAGTQKIAEYEAKLKDAAGTSKEMADITGDNLDGAVRGLGSAWDALRRKLVDPLIGPITEQVKQLTATFDQLTTGEQIKQFQQQLVSAFGSTVQAIKDFVAEAGGVPGVLDKVVGATDRTSKALAVLAANSRAVAGGLRFAFNIPSIVAKGIAAIPIGIAHASGELTDMAGDWLNKKKVIDKETLAAFKNMTRSAHDAWGQIKGMIVDDAHDIAKSLEMMGGAATDNAKAQEEAAKRAAASVEAQKLALKGVTEATSETSLAYKFLAADIAAAADAQQVAAQRTRAGTLFADGKIDVEEYSQALEAANGRIDELTKSAPAAAERIGRIGENAKAATAGISGANDALKELLREREQVVKEFEDLANEITAGPKKPDSELTVLDINRQFDNAQTAFDSGDLNAALQHLRRGREVIQALFDQGSVSKQFLLSQTQRLADLARQGSAAQGAATKASNDQQITAARAQIDGLIADAQPLQTLTVGFDLAGAEQSAKDLRERINRILTAQPITIPVQVAQGGQSPRSNPGAAPEDIAGTLRREALKAGR